MDYLQFVASKSMHAPACGFEPDAFVGPLFSHQDALTRWAIRRGRAAIFAGTGLGKTRCYLAFADAVLRRTGKPVLVLTPLAVAAQGAAEARVLGVDARAVRDGSESAPIAITNYERLHRFDPSRFGGVVLDESSCIKHHNAKTFGQLLAAFEHTPYRLCCTATPAPNDWTELGTHAEFLGVCTRAEMLAEFFVHDGGSTQDWRLKGHARAAFWRWVSSWAALVRSPADLGFPADGYDLPPLEVVQHTLAADHAAARAAQMLFAMPAQSLSERRDARRGSVDARVAACAALVNADDEPWVVWCDLNAESEALVRAIPGAVEVRGAHDADEKEQRLADFSEGRTRVLVTKPSIAGWGLNWQHCARTAFVGVTDSWEAYHQAVRRFWRFGQRRPVRVHVFASELEGNVVANLARKERDAQALADALSAETRASVQAAVLGARRDVNPYEPEAPLCVPAWLRSMEVAA